MEQNKLYVNGYTGQVVTYEHYHSKMMLVKILYKLRIIDVEQTMKIAEKFKNLFV